MRKLWATWKCAERGRERRREGEGRGKGVADRLPQQREKNIPSVHRGAGELASSHGY